jgi:hypothetical protein
VPNIKSASLIKRQAKQVAEAEHRYACGERAQGSVEYDVRRCKHGILQIAQNPVWLTWNDLEWVWNPILTYRAKRALQETDNG